jgi:serine/threonine-protein kinase HipA
MQRELHVFIDIDRAPVLVGRLWARERSGHATSSFTYHSSWLTRRGAFALAPSLMLSSGQFNASQPLFNAFSDTAPDTWGRRLLRRHERARATQAGTQPRTLLDIDFLIGVDDQTRLGALRFKEPTSQTFLTTTGRPVPPLIELATLLSVTEKFERGRETDEDVLLVLAPGTSLGGARPKATVRDKNGRLLVAKFPKRDDEWPMTRWEATALSLAEAAGIVVPEWRLDNVARRPILMLYRFDRVGVDVRVPYMSAMTALDAADHEKQQRSYLELVDVLRQEGSAPEKDLKQLWRRLIFNILISNTDDHLRNHAFLRDAKGWRLSPAYDLNPCPTDVRPRVHALAIDELDGTASLEVAYSVAPSFGMNRNEATSMAADVGAAVEQWREVAKSFGLKPTDADRMASAFEHDDLRKALSGRTTPARGARHRNGRAKRQAVDDHHGGKADRRRASPRSLSKKAKAATTSRKTGLA